MSEVAANNEKNYFSTNFWQKISNRNTHGTEKPKQQENSIILSFAIGVTTEFSKEEIHIIRKHLALRETQLKLPMIPFSSFENVQYQGYK